jgi:GNAT superfamily N-acetyltransferase
MRRTLDLTFHAGIRECRAADLQDLEWYGMHWADRELIRRAFRRAARGRVRMLVADADGYPVAQAWIDLTAKARRRVAVVWALRVHPMFSGKGVGTCVMLAAERVARDEGFQWVEVGIEPCNPTVERFYRRLGYSPCGTGICRTRWRRPDGKDAEKNLCYDLFRKRVGARRGRTDGARPGRQQFSSGCRDWSWGSVGPSAP